MDLVLGIDLGTSFFKCGLFDRTGRLRGLGRVPVPSVSDGVRRELPIDAFWTALERALVSALEEAQARADDIRGVSCSSQANSFLLLDETGAPLTPLILWPDLRAEKVPVSVRNLWQREDFTRITGLGGTTPEMAIAKIVRIREQDPALWRKTAGILTISDYLARELTGRNHGDEGTAALLGLWNLRAHVWWREALDQVGLSPESLSTPLPPGAAAGGLTGPGAARLRLRPEGRMTAGSLDHHMAAIGCGAASADSCCVSLGTVLVCIRGLESFTPRSGCYMGPGLSPETYTQLALDTNGASAIESYRATFAPHLTYPELERLAAAVPDDCDGLTVRPGATARDGLDGFLHRTAGHGPGHYARAIMGSVADSLAHLMDRLYGADRPARIVAVGGGTRSPLWMEIFRRRLGIHLTPARHPEAACRGAALCAAATAGWFSGIPSAVEAWEHEEENPAP
jgi:sugar (pentulose or hexulose) kinase